TAATAVPPGPAKVRVRADPASIAAQEKTADEGTMASSGKPHGWRTTRMIMVIVIISNQNCLVFHGVPARFQCASGWPAATGTPASPPGRTDPARRGNPAGSG